MINFLSIDKASFPNYQEVLKKRFLHVKPHFLQQRQRVFLQRINADLDRNIWLSAICQACIGKTLEKINDADEPLLFDRFVEMVQELDKLQDLTKLKKKGSEDDAIGIDVTTLTSGQQKHIIRVPKKKKNKINKKITQIESILGKEKDVNVVALTKILTELLNND